MGKEAIAKSWLDEQESDTKAYQADKLAMDNEVPKGDRNLDAQIWRVNDERCMAYPVRSRQRPIAVVTTNAEKSAEAEVADCEPVKAKGRIICNVNQECMSRAE